jgi:hypothetical protein
MTLHAQQASHHHCQFPGCDTIERRENAGTFCSLHSRILLQNNIRYSTTENRNGAFYNDRRIQNRSTEQRRKALRSIPKTEIAQLKELISTEDSYFARDRL